MKEENLSYTKFTQFLPEDFLNRLRLCNTCAISETLCVLSAPVLHPSAEFALN